MRIIEQEKLDELIKEYIDKKIPLAVLISENNVSYKQIIYIIKTIKEMLHIQDNNAFTNEDYKNILKYIEDIDEELKDENLPNVERIKLEYDKESAQEELIKSCKSIFDDTINIFFSDIEISEDVYYSYCYEALSEVLNDYTSNSRVNFISLLTSKIIKTIENNFKEIKGVYFEEYIFNAKKIPEIIDIDLMLKNKNNINDSEIDSEDEKDDKNEYFLSDINVEEEVINKIIGENLIDALEMLNEIEKEVIKRRFGLQGNNIESYKEIANKLNKSTERIRQIEQNALIKLRRPGKNKKYYTSPNFPNKFKESEPLIDKVYSRLIELLIFDFNEEAIIYFVNMEGVNWEREDYMVAVLNLQNIIKKILKLKSQDEISINNKRKEIYLSQNKISELRERNYFKMCNIINRETNYMFSMPFIEKLITEYSLNQKLLDRLDIYESEMKL